MGRMLRLLFLGTGAAEGYPALFCRCPNCEQARLLGGHNLRLRSALLVNKDLLIDAGPDLGAAAIRYNVRLSEVRILLFTHMHSDHFYPHNLTWRASECRSTPLPLMKIFAPHSVIEMLSNFPNLDLNDAHLSLVPIGPFTSWEERDYRFQSYPAQHRGDALFYSIDDGRHCLLYATDTAPWGKDVWQALSRHRFDVVILDETMGYSSGGEGHHNLVSFFETFHKFQRLGLLAKGSLFIAHHISHDNPPHDQLVKILEPKGITVAYDGLEICLS